MARIYTKSTSRVAHTCTTHSAPSHEIPKGDGYYVSAPGFRGRDLFRCFKHPFRPSELTNSLRSQPLAALENLEDSIPNLEAGDYDGLTGLLEEFASEVRSYAEERESALDSWENGNSQLEELNDTAQSAADEAEDIQNNVYEFEDEEPTAAEYEDADEFEVEHSDWEQARDEAWATATSDALDAAQSIEF